MRCQFLTNDCKYTYQWWLSIAQLNRNGEFSLIFHHLQPTSPRQFQQSLFHARESSLGLVFLQEITHPSPQQHQQQQQQLSRNITPLIHSVLPECQWWATILRNLSSSWPWDDPEPPRIPETSLFCIPFRTVPCQMLSILYYVASILPLSLYTSFLVLPLHFLWESSSIKKDKTPNRGERASVSVFFFRNGSSSSRKRGQLPENLRLCKERKKNPPKPTCCKGKNRQIEVVW